MPKSEDNINRKFERDAAKADRAGERDAAKAERKANKPEDDEVVVEEPTVDPNGGSNWQ